MRVVHVHRIRGIGGSERHLLTLLPALRECGVERCSSGSTTRAGTSTRSTASSAPSPFELSCPRTSIRVLLRRVRRELRA